MALINCPECGKTVSDRAGTCIHCGFPLSKLTFSTVVSNEPKEHRLAIESIPNGSPKQAPAINIVCNITGMSYDEAKTLVSKKVVIVKDNITLTEAKALASRFKAINVNAATLHNTAPRNWHVMTMEEQREKDASMAKWERERKQQASNYIVPKAKITCSICGSDNVERITTMDRSFSVAMFGLASGKIGKQYKCKKCKHMW